MLVFAVSIAHDASLSAGEPSAERQVSPANAQRLTSDGRLKMDPVFIAGGTELVFTVLESAEQTSLMKLRLSDGVQSRLNPKAATTEFEPAFSGDGRYCAFVQNRGNLSLQLVSRDRVQNGETIFDPGGGFAGMRRPSFAPDAGKLIVSLPAGGGEQIVEIGLDGRRGKNLTEGEALHCWPAFSPDGKQIAFGSNREGDFELYAMNATGGDMRRLTFSPSRDMRPAWSPDGRRIAFTSARDGNTEIYVMHADGSSPVRLTDNTEQDDFAAWHPDGCRLAIVSERAGKFDVYLIETPAEAPKAN
jgi:Tol biopolymer transport system component